jgi:replicative DNA helicase
MPASGEGARQAAVESILDLIPTLQGPRTPLDRDELLRLTAERTGYSAEALATFATEYAERQQRLDTAQTLDRSLRQARAALASQGEVQAVTRMLNSTLATLQVQAEEPPAAFSVERLDGESRQLRRGRSSGWITVDQLGIDFQAGELTVVGARTGHCKTSFLVGLLYNWAKDVEPSTPEEIVLCYTLEEPEVRIYHRVLTLWSVEAGDGWMVNEVRDYLRGGGRLVPTDGRRNKETIEAAKAQLRRWENRLQIIYRPLWTIDQLIAHARDVAQRRRIGGILIDYLQRIPPPTGKLERRDLEVSVIGRRLKALAVDIAAPVVVTAQINREAVRDAVKIPMDLAYTNDKVQNALRSRRPELHQLREGGAEQEADQVVGLINFIADWRQDVEIRGLPMRAPGSVGEATRLEVGVLKSRYGQVGQWDALAFEGRFHRLRDPSSRTEV